MATPFKLKSGNKTSFKDMGSSPVKQTKFPIPRAKRLVKESVGHTTVDSPSADESKFDKSLAKNKKANEILKKEGYSLEDREQMTGAGGYQAAMDWATSKKKSPAKQIYAQGGLDDAKAFSKEYKAKKSSMPKNLNMTGSKASTTPGYKSTKMAKNAKIAKNAKTILSTNLKSAGKQIGQATFKTATKSGLGKVVTKVATRGAGRVLGGPAGLVAGLAYGAYKSGQKHSGGKAVKGQKSFMADAKKNTKSIYKKK